VLAHGRYLGAVLELPVVRLDPDLALPGYARPGDAGLDLVARAAATVAPRGGRALVATGIAVAIPPGYAGLILPRSGNALRHGLTVANAPGLIDAGYRDEVKVILLNTDPDEPYQVHRGDRIAQLVIQAVEQVTLRTVPFLEVSERGAGFGHTGR
jgi:dUTP pyrophosphatase